MSGQITRLWKIVSISNFFHGYTLQFSITPFLFSWFDTFFSFKSVFEKKQVEINTVDREFFTCGKFLRIWQMPKIRKN